MATWEELDIVQKGLVYAGLDTPLKRFLGGFALATSLVLLLKPNFAFTKNGYLRGWGYAREDSTMTPWWTPGAALGGFMASFL